MSIDTERATDKNSASIMLKTLSQQSGWKTLQINKGHIKETHS